MYEVVVTIVAIICALAFTLLFVRSGFLNKIMVKSGLSRPRRTTNWTAFSWESCLKKMNVNANVVFLGDSLVRGGDFHKAFPDVSIINLGSSGDTLVGMLGRVKTVAALKPKKVFVMGGINGLTDYNVGQCSITYAELVKELKKTLPDAEIYFFSVLPISKSKTKKICKNKTIITFNQKISQIVQDNACMYIDIHSRYLVDGELDPSVTNEGLHLIPEGYARWYAEIEKHLKPLQ